MPTFTRNNAPRGRGNGFTLVELLVALFIVALASSVAVMNFNRAGASARDEAGRVARAIAAARDHAVIQSRPVAVMFDAGGYRFGERIGGGWRPLRSDCCKARAYPAPVIARSARKAGERLVFDLSGLPVAPVELVLSDGAGQFRLAVDAAGNIRVES